MRQNEGMDQQTEEWTLTDAHSVFKVIGTIFLASTHACHFRASLRPVVPRK